MDKGLYRRDGYIGGVCQGIGEYTNTSPIAWRLIFLLVPAGFWAYLILWVGLKRQIKSFRSKDNSL
jgi:phage shock protein PspC (stress-responsive transcriptional regulator)